jgi:hypothetical protein
MALGEQFLKDLILGSGTAPILNELVIADSDTSSITLAQPTLANAGNPDPTVHAFIGYTDINGFNLPISVMYGYVLNYLKEPVDVATSGYQFTGLKPNTMYTIIVVASNSVGYSVEKITQSTAPVAPVLNSLSIASSDSSSITLAQPTFSTAGNPKPDVQAYIGRSDAMSVYGSTVSGSLQGPIDVSDDGYRFSGLIDDVMYKIIVVAINSAGYSVQEIMQSTARSTAPVLNSLSISAYDSSSISLAKPTFSTAGNPAPAVQAYIGVSGTIAVSGSTVTGSLKGPIDVSNGGYQFSGLNEDMVYTIVVVASNSKGYSVQQIIQSTAKNIAPVLNSLSLSSTDASSITLAKPTFSTAGNPKPTVLAYIGYSGTISVSGSAVSGTLSGYPPADVSTGGYQFSGLSANTAYTIVVVALNSEGYSVKEISKTTPGIAPVLNGLSLSTVRATSITIAQPTLSTAGNPTPAVQAYIGYNGTITVSGSTVSGSLQGPIDVSAGGYQFTGLDGNTSYRIIVVAANSAGYSVQQIVQVTYHYCGLLGCW